MAEGIGIWEFTAFKRAAGALGLGPACNPEGDKAVGYDPKPIGHNGNTLNPKRNTQLVPTWVLHVPQSLYELKQT